MSDDASSSAQCSIPQLPEDSPGSSVSSALEHEYNELIRYAMVVPTENKLSNPEIIQVGNVCTNESTSETSQDSQKNKLIHDASFATPTSIRSQTSFKPPSRVGFPLDNIVTSSSAESTPEFDKSVRDDEINVIETYSAATDADVGRMEHMLDQWCSTLKRDILAEVSQTKIRVLTSQRRQVTAEREQAVVEQRKLCEQIDQLKELLHTYETSVGRKDQIIRNLTTSVQQQRDKQETMRQFFQWKLQAVQEQREKFTSTLAEQHHRRRITRAAWDAWHSVVESRWRFRVEKACQARAQQLCVQLTNDYEAKISEMQASLDAARATIARLHTERDSYESTMKKAFMKGVCALNMEAMSMFHPAQEQLLGSGDAAPPPVIPYRTIDQIPDDHPQRIPHEPVFTNPPETAGGTPTEPSREEEDRKSRVSFAPSVAVISRPASAPLLQPGAVADAPQSNRVLTARITASGGGGGGKASVVSGPASVVVERHAAVVKETIGRAVAAAAAASAHAPSHKARPAAKTDTLGSRPRSVK